MRDAETARFLIGCLDLTSLNKDDNETSIIKLCEKAQTPYGNTAAVCVYSKFLPTAQKALDGSGIKLASVVNFPAGATKIAPLREEIKKALGLGADEIDAVFPYNAFLQNDTDSCRKFLETVKEECGDKHPCKIILESGELKHVSQIAAASRLCLEYEVDFLKTSTGKTEVSATPEAANVMLEAIAEAGGKTGFKASGGIRSFEEARKYLVLSQVILGKDWPTPHNFRIGASSLLKDLLRVIEEGY